MPISFDVIGEKIEHFDTNLSPERLIYLKGLLNNTLALGVIYQHENIPVHYFIAARSGSFGIFAKAEETKDERYIAALHAGPLFNNLEDLIRSLIHLPALRGNPERNYPIATPGPDFVGRFENYFASVILKWCREDREKVNTLTRYLEALGLTRSVDAHRRESRIEIFIDRFVSASGSLSTDFINLVDAGFGLSQVLPILVALIVAQKNQIIFLEQPEIHLHPRAQALLAHMLVEAANRGVKVVVETHSSSLLLGLRTLVAKGEIGPDNVALYWFSRSPDSGGTQVSKADLDEDGAFGDWPADFLDVELEQESEYLDLISRRRLGQK